MHHKFVVTDSGKPTARVYVGSCNFCSRQLGKPGRSFPRVTAEFRCDPLFLNFF